jgi:hypothetical protein
MLPSLSVRQKDVLDCLNDCGGRASVRNISIKTRIPILTVMECLDSLDEYVIKVEGTGASAIWKRTKNYWR